VAIVNVPGAYLTTDMDEEVFMCLRGRLAELMVKTAPEIYRKYIYVGSDNKPVLYVKLQKAVYGCLRSALLFYQKMLKDLEDNGFELNPYDPCIANKVINGKQFTITWHVEDLKLSHVDSKVVDDTITWIKSIYGEDMRVSRGKKHDYLGMDLDYSVQGEMKVTMIDYLKRVITEFPEEITRTASSPAAERLFTVRPNDESVPLEEKRAIAFHHCVAQLLLASARARKDIQPAVAFLTTRVRDPGEDDWLKLKRLLRYIRGTIHMSLILRAESLNVIKWWLDASFATHDNCRCHTGATMSLGKGSVIGMSKKQKINTRSSTEFKLVGADDAIPQMMWTRYFLEGQGYNVEECILYQDNMSAMLLETNGKQSSSKRTKNIRVRYFFIKDRVSNGDITIKHCPTGEMLTDHFTKPLQGALFRKFRTEIQGIPEGINEAELGWDQGERK
jgi:hypothetical protein